MAVIFHLRVTRKFTCADGLLRLVNNSFRGHVKPPVCHVRPIIKKADISYAVLCEEKGYEKNGSTAVQCAKDTYGSNIEN